MLIQKPLKTGSGKHAKLDVRRSLREIRIILTERPAQEVGREKQADDVLPSVIEGFGELDNARDDIREDGARFTFPKDHLPRLYGALSR